MGILNLIPQHKMKLKVRYLEITVYSLSYISFELKWFWCCCAFCILYCWLDINDPAENSSKAQAIFRMTRWKKSETPHRRIYIFQVLYRLNRLLDKLESSLCCRRRNWQPTPVLLSGESHGQRSLVGYCSWGHKESDMTERLYIYALVVSNRRKKKDLEKSE